MNPELWLDERDNGVKAGAVDTSCDSLPDTGRVLLWTPDCQYPPATHDDWVTFLHKLS